MIQAITGAQDHIHLETYILRGDETGHRVLSALTDRARAGVTVRLLFDAVGSRGLDRRMLYPLRSAGGEIAEFNPPSRWLWRFRPRQRDHRKLLILDGRIGFLGGLNIGDEYVAENSLGPTWRDAHMRIEGPALTELQALFLENWFRSGGGSLDWRALIASEPPSVGTDSIAILADGPMYRRRRVRGFFLDELARAQKRIRIITPYFAPGPAVMDALADASERGVEVELLLAGYTDHPLLRRAARAALPRLMRRGVRVFEDPHRMMHAKLAVFDDHLAFVGTSNLDRQSLYHSCEVNVVFEGSQVAQWIDQHFGTGVHSVIALDPDELAKQSILARWIDRGAAFWARL